MTEVHPSIIDAAKNAGMVNPADVSALDLTGVKISDSGFVSIPKNFWHNAATKFPSLFHEDKRPVNAMTLSDADWKKSLRGLSDSAFRDMRDHQNQAFVESLNKKYGSK